MVTMCCKVLDRNLIKAKNMKVDLEVVFLYLLSELSSRGSHFDVATNNDTEDDLKLIFAVWTITRSAHNPSSLEFVCQC